MKTNRHLGTPLIALALGLVLSAATAATAATAAEQYDEKSGPRTSLGGASTTTQTRAPTLRARAILSWTFAPTDCNFVPIWGTIFNFRLRMDPIR